MDKIRIEGNSERSELLKLVLEIERELDIQSMLVVATNGDLFNRETIDNLQASTITHMMDLCEIIKYKIA